MGTSRTQDRGTNACRFQPRLEHLEDRIVPTKLPKGFVETIIPGAITRPTAMEFTPAGDRLFVLEQGGAVRIIENGALLPDPFVTITVDTGPTFDSERGLLGIAFDPDFANNNFVYFYYSHPDDAFSTHNQVSRFTADGNVAVEGSEQVIFELPPLGLAYHNGGAIRFGIDNFLYIATGENFVSSNAQSLDTTLGKILRINADGTIPDNNPFSEDPNVVDENKAIWAYGLRNPFKLDIDRNDGRIFINDVGDGDNGDVPFEEINRGIAGANYGWDQSQGPSADPDHTDPLFSYKHTGKPLKSGCAITGGAFYRTDNLPAFGAKFDGDYFFTDLCNGWIRVLDRVKGKVAKFAKDVSPAMTDLKVNPANGSLWYSSLDGGGMVAQITKGPPPPGVRSSQPDVSVLLADPMLAREAKLALAAEGPARVEPRPERPGQRLPAGSLLPPDADTPGIGEVLVSEGEGSAEPVLEVNDPLETLAAL